MKKCLSLVIILLCLAPLYTFKVSAAELAETMVKQDKNVGHFNKVVFSGGGDLIVAPSPRATMEVVGHASCLDLLATENKSGTLIISRKRNQPNDCKLSIYISLPKLLEIEQRGGGQVLIEPGFDPVDTFKYSIHGGGAADLQNFKVNSFYASIKGGGKLSVYAEKRLNININGGGLVLYRGAAEVSDYISGGGTIEKLKSDKAIESGQFTDVRDNRTYKTVKIGEQEWMAENFAYLPYVCKSIEPHCGVWVYGYSGDGIAGAKESAEYKEYGALYSWSAAKKLAPDGWRLPSDEDWQVLERYIGIEASDIRAKEWRGNNSEADKLKVNGSTGLNVVFGGWMTDYGKFNFIEEHANFWCSNEVDEERACERMIGVNNGKIGRAAGMKGCGFSVRYVRDVPISVAQANTH